MGFFKNIFSKRELISSYDDFWSWFCKNEKSFFAAVKEQENVEKNFFDKLRPQLHQLREDIFYLAGMYDNDTVELILTADGFVKNFTFVEDLVLAAPSIPGWKLTALKPAIDSKTISIEMAGYQFNDKTMGFYANNLPDYPDEIDITIACKNWDEGQKNTLSQGVYIFLDNYLGELDFASILDRLKVTGTKDAVNEVIPIEKLKSYLHWRQKEFIEKYEGNWRDTDNDKYSIFEAELQNGKALIAVINEDLLHWDSKASHPWILVAEIKYDGSENNGMPDEKTYQLLDEIEQEMADKLKDFDGHLNIGRQTSDNTREIYFACKDFRKASRILDKIQHSYKNRIDLSYDFHKDKYWHLFERFIGN